MRILFAGTPGLAVLPLETLTSRYTIVGVLCSPDKPAGRGRKLSPPPVKLKALELGLPVYQPPIINADFRETIRALRPDILVVVAYHKIFRKSFLDLFPEGGLNLHPSLLPRHRGPSPLQAAILSGDHETGVTIQKLALQMDAGDIMAQKRFSLTGKDTIPDLIETAAGLGSEMLISVLERIRSGDYSGIPQDEDKATFCHIIEKKDGEINWNDGAEKIDRMIRAYLLWPKAFTSYKGRLLFLLNGEALPEIDNPDSGKTAASPGMVLGTRKKYGILVMTGRGVLFIKKLQIQSKKAMDWHAFLNGNRDFIGSQLGGTK